MKYTDTKWVTGDVALQALHTAPKAEANAKLRAAAPELYEALKAIFEHCALVHKHWGDGCNAKQAKAAIEAGHIALGKVEGRQ